MITLLLCNLTIIFVLFFLLQGCQIKNPLWVTLCVSITVKINIKELVSERFQHSCECGFPHTMALCELLLLISPLPLGLDVVRKCPCFKGFYLNFGIMVASLHFPLKLQYAAIPHTCTLSRRLLWELHKRFMRSDPDEAKHDFHHSMYVMNSITPSTDRQRKIFLPKTNT